MGKVILYTDIIGFNRFLDGKDFYTTTSKGELREFIVQVPATAIDYTERKGDSYMVKVREKDKW